MKFPNGSGQLNKIAQPIRTMLTLMATAVGVGALASLAAVAFVECVAFLNEILLISPDARARFEDQRGMILFATLAVPTLGGLAVGLVHSFAGLRRRPTGPSDVIEAVQFRTSLPSLRTGLVFTSTAILSLGCGASVGHYGPMVYLGALCGSIARRLRIHASDIGPIALACGVAAAISTAFNAPIAGIVFAHEVVLRHYSTQAFAPVTMAAATGFVVDNLIFDRPPLFPVDFSGVTYGHEFLLFAMLGVFAAAVAIIYMRLVLKMFDVVSKVPLPFFARPAAAGLAVGLVALWLPEILGVGWDVQRAATTEGAFEISGLVLLIVAKVFLTALCLAFGFSGGVFGPALLIGSLVGALFWMVAGQFISLPTSGVAAYAISGMMAVASPVIGAPLTCILIVFELTRNYDVAVAAMVAVVIANLIAHRVFGRSLFDAQLAARGVDLSLGRTQARLRTMKVADYAEENFVTTQTSASVADAVALLEGRRWNEVFVTDDDGRFAGVFRLAAQPASGSLGEAISQPMAIFDENTTIVEAMDALCDFVGDAVPVVHSQSGELLGVVPEAVLLTAYLNVERSLRQEENASL